MPPDEHAFTSHAHPNFVSHSECSLTTRRNFFFFCAENTQFYRLAVSDTYLVFMMIVDSWHERISFFFFCLFVVATKASASHSIHFTYLSPLILSDGKRPNINIYYFSRWDNRTTAANSRQKKYTRIARRTQNQKYGRKKGERKHEFPCDLHCRDPQCKFYKFINSITAEIRHLYKYFAQCSKHLRMFGPNTGASESIASTCRFCELKWWM